MRKLLLVVAAVSSPVFAEEIKLPTGADDLKRGKTLYMGACTYCHGPTGDGGNGADLSRRELRFAKTDGDLARIIEVGLPGTEMPGMMHMTRNEVLQTAAFVRALGRAEAPAAALTGNAAKGEALYAKHNCAACHTIDSKGGYMGPDLSVIGSRRSAAHLREAIVDPSASVPNNFIYTTLTLADGRKITGARLWEDSFIVNVRDFAGNNHSIDKSRVTQVTKEQKKSPMPGYRDKLSTAEIEDLVAYMAARKEAR